MIEWIMLITIFSIAGGFEYYWRWNDKRKINAYIERIGGEVTYINKISFREHIYAVEYEKEGVRQSKTVKFTFTQDEIWY